MREHGSDRATFEGTVTLDGATSLPGTAEINFSVTDQFSIKGTGGGLKGLHGQGRAIDDDPPVSGVYEGQFHFDP